MKIRIATSIALLILAFFTCEKIQKNISVKEKTKEIFIDSLMRKSNKVEISYYVNFLKSKIQITKQPYQNAKTLYDSIPSFFGNQLNNKCYLDKSTIPDGEIRFYNNETTLISIQFVLNNDCSGLYTDFSQHSEKFELTEYGKKILKKNKP